MPRHPITPDTTDLTWDRAERAIADHRARTRPFLTQLWRYYRNPLTRRAGDARLQPAQREGLPPRLTRPAGPHLDDRARTPEAVIENDIAWRIHTMVDFMFGKPVRLVSTAHDEHTRRAVERTLDTIWESSGGVALLQETALLGHVYGHVDLLLRIDEPALAALGDRANPDDIADTVAIEPIDPTRGIPIPHDHDSRALDAYIIHADRDARAGDSPDDRHPEGRRPLSDWIASWRNAAPAATRGVTEVFTRTSRELRIDGRPAERHDLFFTPLPVVHIQNVAQPFRYAGLSEVEPLIPLQDELNTRLSDRAFRVTMQSFKMYLARGLTGFDRLPVGPGQIWSTDNTDASVEAFGGDAASPSETAHIKEIRDALDKTSAVPPLATGVVQGRVGNLSSANALKITLVGLLAKTERKRITYGRGIAEISRMILGALDEAGVLHTHPADRSIRLEWPDPLPTDLDEETLAAKRKLELGVPHQRVLDELGYQPTDDGVV